MMVNHRSAKLCSFILRASDESPTVPCTQSGEVPLIPTIARVLKMEDAFGLKSMMGKGRHGLGVMAPGD